VRHVKGVENKKQRSLFVKQFSAKGLRVVACAKVIDMLQDEEAQSLANLSDFIGKPISLQAEPSYTQEAFDIILM
jgi:ribonuclease G